MEAHELRERARILRFEASAVATSLHRTPPRRQKRESRLHTSGCLSSTRAKYLFDCFGHPFQSDINKID